MSGPVSLDLRYPIGGLFIVLGFILAGYGLVTADNVETYRRSASVHINLGWGVVMLAFGALFMLLAWRARRRASVAGGL
ncbi:MAG: hypothetical protein ACT4P7_02590 [Gemmatimonadaceae bacterium]